MVTAAHRSRMLFLVMGLLMITAVLWMRLLWLQILEPDHWISIARRQQIEVLELPSTRGAIVDRNRKPLAVSIRLNSVFANPRHIKNARLTAQKLASVVNRSEEELFGALSNKKRGFVWIARQIPNGAAALIQKMNLRGVEMMLESRRVYPQGHMASHLVGFAGLDTQGLEGLELHYDKLLKGEPGWRWMNRDARQRPMGTWAAPFVAPRDGFELVLTLDTPLQYLVEQEMDRIMEKNRPEAASVVVMDPVTGEILALANRPAYDPNQYGSFPVESRRNRALTDPFEPGSVFKVVTAATALATQSVDPDEKFYCEQGEYKVAGRILHDHRPHGWLTFRDVIALSSNIGTAKVAMRMGPEPLYQGMKAFGFGEKTGIGLPGEAAGLVKHPKDWSRPSITVIPMGHEVAVTALQLAQGISVVANGGLLVRPRIVREIRSPSGELVKETAPQVVRRVIHREVAQAVQEIMAEAVETGTGRQAQVRLFGSAGKTGTAQKVEPTGGYSHSKFIASFAGFTPVESPRLTIVVVVNEPKGTYYGGTVSAPAFKRIAEGGLAYLRQEQAIQLVRANSEVQ